MEKHEVSIETGLKFIIINFCSYKHICEYVEHLKDTIVELLFGVLLFLKRFVLRTLLDIKWHVER